MLSAEFQVPRPYGEAPAAATVLDFQGIARFWPVSMEDTDIIHCLQDCARKSHIRAKFLSQSDITDVRAILFTCLQDHSFRGHFIRTFKPLVPTLLNDVGLRNGCDHLHDFHAASLFQARAVP